MKPQFLSAVVIVALAASPRIAAADCFDTPAVCHLRAGIALMAETPPKAGAAAKELYASYQAENKTSTYALYVYALHVDKQYALSSAIWRRVRTRLDKESKALHAAIDAARAANDATTTAAREADLKQTDLQIANAETELTALESQTAHVKLTYAGGVVPPGLVVARRTEGDVKDPFAQPILVNAIDDLLTVTYPDGSTKDLPISLVGGGEQTVVVPAMKGTEPPPPPPDPGHKDPGGTVLPPPPPPPTAAHSHAMQYTGYGALGVAAVSFGVAALFQVKSSNDWDSAQTSGCTDDACIRGSAGAALAQDSVDHAHIALGAAIAGTIFAGAGVALLVVDHGHHAERREARLQVVPTGGGVAAFMTGRF